MKLDFKGFSKDQLVQFQDSIQGPARFFKVQDGTSKIRFFVSPKETSPAPFYPNYVHWYTTQSGQKASILCTQRTPGIDQKPCPICQLVADFYRSDNAEVVGVAKESKPSLSFLQWGFVKGPKDQDWRPDPAVVSIPKTIMTNITEVCTMDDDFVDLYSFNTGRFVNVSRKKDSGSMYRYVYTVLPSSSSMDITGDAYAGKIQATTSILEMIGIPTDEEQQAAAKELQGYAEHCAGGAAVLEEEEDEGFGSSVRSEMKSFSDALNVD